MIGDRIKTIRTDTGLSQAAFGERLGVSRDVVNNVENGRLKRPSQKESLYKLICREFGVNEQWLRTGEGRKYCSAPKSVVDEATELLKLNDFEALILRAYMDLPKNVRDSFCAGMYDNLFMSQKITPVPAVLETGEDDDDMITGVAVAKGGAEKVYQVKASDAKAMYAEALRISDELEANGEDND